LLKEGEDEKAYHFQMNQSEDVIYEGIESIVVTPFDTPEPYKFISSNYIGRFFAVGKVSNKIYTWEV
jgi:hypothetical protein